MNLIDKTAEALEDTSPWVQTREGWQAATRRAIVRAAAEIGKEMK